eukprot:11721153-Heterocapsa_arctica.AAC.1
MFAKCSTSSPTSAARQLKGGVASAHRRAMPADMPAWRTSRAGSFRNMSSKRSRNWLMLGVSTPADP